VQLSFSEQIRNDMNETKEFDSILKQLANLDSSKIKDKENQTIFMHIKNLIERLTWNLTDKAYKKSVSTNNATRRQTYANKFCFVK
jgi:ribonuclease HIII